MIFLPGTHPYWHVRSVIEKNSIKNISMSYYKYQPQTIDESREEVKISCIDFLNDKYILDLMNRVPAGCELALNSNVVTLDEQEGHLVMIDMATAAKAHLEKLREFIGDNFFQTMHWYFSGRSFHGYGSGVLSKNDWVKFMGLLLLANKPKLEPTVDPRWIGHRLLGGYSALRWTKNTLHYLTLPQQIEKYKNHKTI